MALDDRTARSLAQLGEAQRAATERRDEAVRQAVAAGGSLREVGGAVGLSHAGVAKIVRRGPSA